VTVLASSRTYYWVETLGESQSSMFWVAQSSIEATRETRESVFQISDSQAEKIAVRKMGSDADACDGGLWQFEDRFNACGKVNYLYTHTDIVNGAASIVGWSVFYVKYDILASKNRPELHTSARFKLIRSWGTARNTWILTKGYCRDSHCQRLDLGSIASDQSFTLGPDNRRWTSGAAFKRLGKVEMEGPLNAALGFTIAAAGAFPPTPGEKIPTVWPPTVRCDRKSYVGSRGGCVLLDFAPFFRQSERRSAPYWDSARFVRDSQIDIKAHPGEYALGGAPLNRLYWGGRGATNLNRDEATKRCKALTQPGSCDEYPFATTFQGCFRKPKWCRVDRVILSHNVGLGRELGKFMTANRIISTDKYWTWITN
jgi:hypothetical protein